jgi:CRISPR-associated protein Csd2
MTLKNKIDFAVILRVKNANPNGDPLNGNRPRTNYENYGEITDVCIKRKIRDRLLERFSALEGDAKKGQAILVQSDDRKVDDAMSIGFRAKKFLGDKLGSAETTTLACKEWIDVRAFGQLFALSGGKSKNKKGKQKDTEKNDSESENNDAAGVSVGIRGPVTIQSAFSVTPIEITSIQITKSASGDGDGEKRSSDSMGMKHRVDSAVYVFYGSMNPQLAERTGFSDQDAEAIKQVLPKLFENDESSARPAGSMEVLNVFWWKHNCKAGQYSSAKVHQTLHVNADGSHKLEELAELKREVIKGR